MANAQSHPQHVPAHGQPSVPGAATTERLKCVPDQFVLREQIAAAAERSATALAKSHPPTRRELETNARRLLNELQLSEAYLGWAMVAVASAFWHDQVAAVPYHRRLLLLPRCLRDERTCPAECDELGLSCRDCGACGLGGLRAEARRHGYRVLIAEGSPAVMKLVLAGQADAVLGVACLDSLEKMFEKLVRSGVPAMAVPLLCNGCHRTAADEAAIRRLIDVPYRPGRRHTRSYLHLVRCAAQLFEPDELRRLAPAVRLEHWPASVDRAAVDRLDPVACTEALAYDFLVAGGKHSRPFIAMAVFDAIGGGAATNAAGAEPTACMPDAVKAVALATEAFHKASLVHDDVEDDDGFRYGCATLHRRFGPATAINVGDYLIGLGYRLVAGQRENLPAEVVADLVALFASAHMRLCEGQGAELIWRDARDKTLRPLDALRIYALKTAPAFEAALLAGARLAGPIESVREPIARYARHLGVAYQIVNDLADWAPDDGNKVDRATDLLAGRPTILWALSMEKLDDAGRRELEAIAAGTAEPAGAVERATERYRAADAFGRAQALLEKHHARAIEAAAQLPEEPLRRLLHFLADAIVDRRPLGSY